MRAARWSSTPTRSSPACPTPRPSSRRLPAAERATGACAARAGGRLRLDAFPSAGASIMPEAIARFRERHPAVELTLEPAEPEPSLAKLRRGDAARGLDRPAG